MTFFNFQQDNDGKQQFQVSDKWWWYLAATIPLTAAVFAIWIVWQKLKFAKEKKEEGIEILESKEYFWEVSNVFVISVYSFRINYGQLLTRPGRRADHTPVINVLTQVPSFMKAFVCLFYGTMRNQGFSECSTSFPSTVPFSQNAYFTSSPFIQNPEPILLEARRNLFASCTEVNLYLFLLSQVFVFRIEVNLILFSLFHVLRSINGLFSSEEDGATTVVIGLVHLINVGEAIGARWGVKLLLSE